MQYKEEAAVSDDNCILLERRGRVAIITLNRPAILNAWDTPMRLKLIDALEASERDAGVRSIILTGAGERAFGAGQDLREAQSFDEDRAELWLREWERLYDLMRSLSKPFLAALNGLAAGSAFQVALLTDMRIGHPGVKMGQPEINSGLASITGGWIIREHLGLARTTDLVLTGRMMDAQECYNLGLINRLVPPSRVLDETVALAEELGDKSQLAVRVDKQWLREMTETGFRNSIEAGIRFHRQTYGSGEPARLIEDFIQDHAARK